MERNCCVSMEALSKQVATVAFLSFCAQELTYETSVWSASRSTRALAYPRSAAVRSPATTPRSRKSGVAIRRREFVPRDPRSANQLRRCMPRWQVLGSGTTRGGRGRVRATSDFPTGGAGRRPRVGLRRFSCGPAKAGHYVRREIMVRLKPDTTYASWFRFGGRLPSSLRARL